MAKASTANKQTGLPDTLTELLRIDRQICFLLYKASGRMTKLYKPILDPLGLTYPQYLVMLVLWEKAPRTVGELCQCVEMEIGTLSPLLKRMETAGFVQRRRDKADERRVLVGLTAEGKALYARALREVPPALACGIKLPIDELIALHEGLTRLIDGLTSAPNQSWRKSRVHAV